MRHPNYGRIMFRAIVAATLTAVLASALGCAGPATPLGAVWATDSSQVKNGPLSFIASIFKSADSEIRFTPHRQVLHGRSPIMVSIKDPAGIKSNYRVVVRHNGLDVTHAFLKQAEVTIKGTELTLAVPNIRLTPKNEHLIEVIYGAGTGSEMTAYARYAAPLCRAFEARAVQTTEAFSPPVNLLEVIEQASRHRGFSPAFTTALVAQESSFNTRTVSWAKAVGLTQVTPIAEDEITAELENWPRYPGLNELPAPVMKMLVLSGHVNETNEWRLDPERSVHGGLAYMKLLSQRWSSPESMARIQQHFEDPQEGLTRLILASYNSGYSRVASAFNRHGAGFLQAGELKEARKYVNRITSFCDHFSTSPLVAPSIPARAPASSSETRNSQLNVGGDHENET